MAKVTYPTDATERNATTLESSGIELVGYDSTTKAALRTTYGYIKAAILSVQHLLTGGASGASPTPQLKFGNYLDNSGDPSISHIDLYNAEIGLGITSNQLNIFTKDKIICYDIDSLAVPLLKIDSGNAYAHLHGDVEIYDTNDLAAESLSETDFATHATWDTVGDWDDTGGNAVYTHSGGTGTLTQTSGNMAIAGVGGAWYKFTYTVSSPSGDVAATITTAFASVATSLNLTAGTNTTYFQAAASPGNFIISATSSSGAFTLDDVTLKQINGGDLTVRGTIYAEDEIELVNHLVMDQVAGDPSQQSNRGLLYVKDVSGTTELFFMRDSGAAQQIT